MIDQRPGELIQLDDDAGDGRPYQVVNFILLDKGQRIDPHSHPWGHMTIVARGRIRARHKDGTMKSYPRPGLRYDGFVTPPEVMHEMEAEEDNTLVLCVNRSESLDHGERKLRRRR